MYNEEFHNLYAVQNITDENESRGIRWVRYVVYKGQTSNAYKVLFEQSDVNRPVRRLGVDRKYWNTSSTNAYEVVDWQGVGISGRTL